MFALLHMLRSILKLSSSPARVSRVHDPDVDGWGQLGWLDEAADFSRAEFEAPAGPVPILDRPGGTPIGTGTLHMTPEGIEFFGHLAEAPATRFAGSAVINVEPRPILDAENRRAGIRAELAVASPRPDRDRVRALAEYSQTARDGHDEQQFAWAAFNAAGGSSLSPWRAFQAGLRAAADRLDS